LIYYLQQLERGDVDLHRDGRVVSESGCCLLYDGENGMGQAVADICCHHAVRIAAGSGMAMVVARDSNHFGAAAYWAQKISSAGMIGLAAGYGHHHCGRGSNSQGVPQR
jgi:LDH2 family malate/lactate/ureidoglycolate dehydrogenase